MPFDLGAHIGAMTRTVENLERDGQPAKAVVASCLYDTDAADLWDALTSRERLKRWFLPVTGDLKLGGRYQFEGNAGGTITECEPQRKIAATWEFGGGITWVTMTLTPEGAGTQLKLEHVSPIHPMWNQFGPGAVGVGWDLALMGLAMNVADPAASIDPQAGASWPTTPEGREFVGAVSTDWGRAAIGAGDTSEAALAAAENTRRFYTGEAPPAER
jgi:uncharacterized protein YndB with AHSA1/START domain